MSFEGSSLEFLKVLHVSMILFVCYPHADRKQTEPCMDSLQLVSDFRHVLYPSPATSYTYLSCDPVLRFLLSVSCFGGLS